MITKIIFCVIAILQLLSGAWAANIAFADTTSEISTLAMMGMLGSLFHSSVLIAAMWFPARVQKIIALLLLLWHIPEAILIASYGMGIPEDQQLVGILTHGIISIMAIAAWYFSGKEKNPEMKFST